MTSASDRQSQLKPTPEAGHGIAHGLRRKARLPRCIGWPHPIHQDKPRGVSGGSLARLEQGCEGFKGCGGHGISPHWAHFHAPRCCWMPSVGKDSVQSQSLQGAAGAARLTCSRTQSDSLSPALWDSRTQPAFVPAGALMTMVSTSSLNGDASGQRLKIRKVAARVVDGGLSLGQGVAGAVAEEQLGAVLHAQAGGPVAIIPSAVQADGHQGLDGGGVEVAHVDAPIRIPGAAGAVDTCCIHDSNITPQRVQASNFTKYFISGNP